MNMMICLAVFGMCRPAFGKLLAECKHFCCDWFFEAPSVSRELRSCSLIKRRSLFLSLDWLCGMECAAREPLPTFGSCAFICVLSNRSDPASTRKGNQGAHRLSALLMQFFFVTVRSTSTVLSGYPKQRSISLLRSSSSPPLVFVCSYTECDVS